jgi:hypothetical protein
MIYSAVFGQIFTCFNLEKSYPSRFNILRHQIIDDVDMFGSITDFVIVRNVDGDQIVAKHGYNGNCQIKLFEGIRQSDPLFRSECKSHIFGFIDKSHDRLVFLGLLTDR